MGLSRIPEYDNFDIISKAISDKHDQKGSVNKDNPIYLQIIKDNPNIDTKELDNPNSEIWNKTTDDIAQKLRKEGKTNPIWIDQIVGNKDGITSYDAANILLTQVKANNLKKELANKEEKEIKPSVPKLD